MPMPGSGVTPEKKHSLSLKNREKLTLDGITEVVSFDDGAVVLNTAMGALTVEGEGLHVTKLLLDCGEVAVEGRITALLYAERCERTKGGLFRRFGG